MQLTNAVALVTGGGSGIGRAVAEALTAEGGRVTIMGRKEQSLREAAREIGAAAGAGTAGRGAGEASSPAVDWIVGDVGVEADAVRAVRSVIEKHGRLDVLVNNAGYGLFKPLVETTLEEMEALYRTNVFGAFLMAREAAKQFIVQGSGELINVASTSSQKGSATRTAYGSSKFALRGMAECWRDELRRHNVRVMTVNPSEVMTDFAAKAGERRPPSDKKLRPREIADAIIGALKVDSRGFVPEFSVFATNPF
jgi:3-oxoacyl-[acyl-carrier protein] reductase